MEVAMFKPLGLDHVVLRVRDQAKSRRFYEEVLGCTLAKFNERISLIHLRFGEALIDLLPATAAAGPIAPDHFCLSIECDDLKAVAEDLRRRAVVLEGDIVQRFGAFGDGPSLYLRDPDGNMIELKPRP
jgi:glyoxylase I family protein